MANNDGARDPEEQQNELMATIKAARELGPDMDKAVVASYLEKQKAAARAQKPQPQQQAVVASGSQQPSWPMFMTPGLGIILYIALLVASGGHLWWTFWLIPAFGFGGWGWWGSRHDEHVQRRMDRYEWRRARYGYRYGPPAAPYDTGYGSAPTQQPQVQPPTAQQPQPTQPQSHEYD